MAGMFHSSRLEFNDIAMENNFFFSGKSSN